MPRLFSRAIVGAAVVVASPVIAPPLLAFPYSTTIRQHRVYSEQPIDPRLAALVAEADAMAAKSPLSSSRAADQPIFLTDGGWRWTWLALRNRTAYAVSRPLIETIVINRSSVTRDLVENRAGAPGSRSLHATLAHEMTHGLIRAHFGPAADFKYPAELREGYCDYVAGGGSLTDAEARALIASGRDVPALTYWRGRKKVEAALASNGGNVDALFANWQR